MTPKSSVNIEAATGLSPSPAAGADAGHRGRGESHPTGPVKENDCERQTVNGQVAKAENFTWQIQNCLHALVLRLLCDTLAEHPQLFHLRAFRRAGCWCRSSSHRLAVRLALVILIDVILFVTEGPSQVHLPLFGRFETEVGQW
jgi:hypothetical protein